MKPIRILSVLFLLGCAQGQTDDDSNFNSQSNANNYNNMNNGFGDICTDGFTCDSGYCVAFPDRLDLGCTALCTSQDCPTGFSCRQAARDDTTTVCLALSTNVCAACAQDNQCGVASDRCFLLQSIGGCLTECSVQGQCPNGFTCSDMTSVGGVTGRYCRPDDGVCGCNESTAGTQTSCTNENEYGSCQGIKECMGASGWGPCNAATPALEICDGNDNNCDGNVDEGLLGTAENCSACGDVCDGSGIEGTTAGCVNDECTLSCEDGYFDPDQLDSTGCECKDDTIGGATNAGAKNLGSFTDCDFTHTVSGLRIPRDDSGPAHKDYFSYGYENTGGIVCWNYNHIEVSVPSTGVSMRLCGGNTIDENQWECVTASPTTPGDLLLPEIDDGISVEVTFSVENISSQNSWGEYLLRVYDDGDLF